MSISSLWVASFRCLACTNSHLIDFAPVLSMYDECVGGREKHATCGSREIYTTWFFFSPIVFFLSFIGGDWTIILVKNCYFLVVLVFTNFSLLTYCSYPWLRLLARHRRWMHPWSHPSTWSSRQSGPAVISLGSGRGALQREYCQSCLVFFSHLPGINLERCFFRIDKN
jgi:hypothetical protein